VIEDELEFDYSNFESEETKELFNFYKTYFEGVEEKRYTSLDNTEDNHVGD